MREPDGNQRRTSNRLAPVRGERLVLVGAGILVAGVAVLAFAVSFDAISAHAVGTGAFPPGLGWAAPLLVDTFTVAATLVVFARSRVGVRAPFAWIYIAASTLVSLSLNVAHAPDRLDAQLVAALPPLAQLAAIELLMSEARRLTFSASLSEPVTAREQIRRLLAATPDGAVSGPEAAAVAGVSVRRAQQLLAELRERPGRPTELRADDVGPRRPPARPHSDQRSEGLDVNG